jgi:hypothetical protein
MHFGENKRSPSSIGISPLPTAHRLVSQDKCVRASTRFYARFTLAMGSSPGFVLHPSDRQSEDCTRPIQTRFRCASGCNSLRLATEMNSQTHSPKGTPSDRAGSHRLSPALDPPLVLRLLVSVRFQVLFHSARSRTFHLSLTVLVHYRLSSVFSLGEWAPQFPTGLACPVVLRISTSRG